MENEDSNIHYLLMRKKEEVEENATNTYVGLFQPDNTPTLAGGQLQVYMLTSVDSE